MTASVKKILLDRAAENAFQNGEVHLANSLYDITDSKAAAEDPPEPQQSNEYAEGEGPHDYDPSKD